MMVFLNQMHGSVARSVYSHFTGAGVRAYGAGVRARMHQVCAFSLAVPGLGGLNAAQRPVFDEYSRDGKLSA
jgi:hypothetical protein